MRYLILTGCDKRRIRHQDRRRLRNIGGRQAQERRFRQQHPPAMNSLMKLNPLRSSVWDPFPNFGELENRLQRALGIPLTTKNGGEKEAMTVAQWSPLVDITEDEKEYLIKAELPEVKKEDVKVTVENGVMTLSGERKFEKEEKNKKYHRVERSYGSFMRSFTLPEGTSGDKVTADFKDGVLKVHLPKDEKVKPKAVEVNVQ